MIHYVMLKFAPGTDLDATEAMVRETFAELDQTLDFLNEPVVYRNIVVRDANADLMVVMRLDKEENLPMYLNHPLHVALVEKMGATLISKMSIDHE